MRGFNPEALAEDTNLTLRLILRGHRVHTPQNARSNQNNKEKGGLPKTQPPNLIVMLHFSKGIHNFTRVSIFRFINEFFFAHEFVLPHLEILLYRKAELV